METKKLQLHTLEQNLDGLYSGQGVICIPRALTATAHEQLLAYSHTLKHSFERARTTVGRAAQDFFHQYWEKDELRKLASPLSGLLEEYNSVIEPVARAIGLERTTANSVGIHHYPPTAQGIGPHRDNKDVQLISIFNLCGDADWFTAADYDRSGERRIPIEPNSLLVMRGPRNEQERIAADQKRPGYDARKNVCPIHYVGEVRSDRLAILLRHYA